MRVGVVLVWGMRVRIWDMWVHWMRAGGEVVRVDELARMERWLEQSSCRKWGRWHNIYIGDVRQWRRTAGEDCLITQHTVS